MFNETSQAQPTPSKVFIIGLQPNDQLLSFVTSMKERGYNDKSTWNCMAVEWSRLFTKWYGIQSVPKSKEIAPYLDIGITSILTDSLPQNVQLSPFLSELGGNYIPFISARPWQLVMEFEYIPF